ncbi:hypothetical protein LUR56_39315 [Streptomyces sp. MT29]|nr:hypothetical protein [Streptomyces sp. MT29]
MSITIRWKSTDAKGMAREVRAAYRLRLKLIDRDTGRGITTPEALVAEETADAMAQEFQRIHGRSHHNF